MTIKSVFLRVVMFLWGTLVCFSVPQAVSEYQVKAAFLLNFTKFVTWPPRFFDSDSAPLTICIAGEDPFGRDLDQLVAGERIGFHPLNVERVRRGSIPKSCRVVFISKSEKGQSEILDGLGAGVLTVGEEDRFIQEGGMIAFVIEDRHVRFDINQRTAANAGLTVNARMLNVARMVKK